MVITTASDADSSGDGKVVANSVEGEDDIVDVTMKDAASIASANAAAMPPPELPLPNQPQLLRHFNSQRPKFIQPGEFLDPELQGLFELSYFANRTDGTVPTGWTNVDNHKTLPKLADRIPEDRREEEDQPSPESWNSTASGNEESSNEEENPQQESSQTRMADESSEEDVPHGARVSYSNLTRFCFHLMPHSSPYTTRRRVAIPFMASLQLLLHARPADQYQCVDLGSNWCKSASENGYWGPQEVQEP
jgi:ubiquitin carboxyl-terminal hydrolase 4/11/15